LKLIIPELYFSLLLKISNLTANIWNLWWLRAAMRLSGLKPPSLPKAMGKTDSKLFFIYQFYLISTFLIAIPELIAHASG
jgi:hypothetical protein